MYFSLQVASVQGISRAFQLTKADESTSALFLQRCLGLIPWWHLQGRSCSRHPVSGAILLMSMQSTSQHTKSSPKSTLSSRLEGGQHLDLTCGAKCIATSVLWIYVRNYFRLKTYTWKSNGQSPPSTPKIGPIAAARIKTTRNLIVKCSAIDRRELIDW